MDFDIQKEDNYTLVKVNSDNLDTNNAPDLKSELVVISNKGENNIVLDLSNCTFCDSSGLRAVLVGNRLCTNASGTFVVNGLQPNVESLIRLTMLHTVLQITKTVEEAEIMLNEKENIQL
ncbi:MAG: anti-anti-sigma factor [Draconibacterium sp.]|nr:MAG: anti-anti-sigma factor [Draconibacterium sp.]